jgi:hypothetical protein
MYVLRDLIEYNAFKKPKQKNTTLVRKMQLKTKCPIPPQNNFPC